MICFLLRFPSLGSGPFRKSFVETTIFSLGTLSVLKAFQKRVSAFPNPYTSAVSKKLIPCSRQYLTDSVQRVSSFQLTKFPKETTETRSQLFPK